ncbi:hypothetical protein [Thermosynechococcus sp. FA-CM-4201]
MDPEELIRKAEEHARTKSNSSSIEAKDDSKKHSSPIGRSPNNDPIIEAKKQAAKDACLTLVKRCTDLLISTGESRELAPDKLISDAATLSFLPNAVTEQINSLATKISFIIHDVAEQIENENYKNWQEAVEGLSAMPRERREQLEGLVEGEKQINISVQSLGITVEVFSFVNKQILGELESAEIAGDKEKQKKLIVYNGVLVHELAKAIIKYLDQFKVYGLDKIREVDKSIRERIQKINSQIADLERLANKPAIDPVTAETYKSQIRNSREIVERMLAAWQEYKDKTDQASSQAIKACGDLRTRLEAKKSSAALQICLLDVALMIGTMRETFQEFEKITTEVEGLELAVLTPERVTSLFLQ